MRDRAYRIHQKERIKHKIISRLKNEQWKTTEIDWENIMSHYDETEMIVSRYTRGGLEHEIEYERETDESHQAHSLVYYMSGGKHYWKAPKWFKKIYSRRRRAKVKDRMIHEDYDNIPVFRKENDWNWD